MCAFKKPWPDNPLLLPLETLTSNSGSQILHCVSEGKPKYVKTIEGFVVLIFGPGDKATEV